MTKCLYCEKDVPERRKYGSKISIYCSYECCTKWHAKKYKMKKEKIGTYNKHTHSEHDCDKCGKRVGIDNLSPVGFLYKDKNDLVHKDLGQGYRQYWVCKECMRQ